MEVPREERHVSWVYLSHQGYVQWGATRVGTFHEGIDYFLINIGLHQLSYVSPFLLIIDLDELIEGIQDKGLSSMVFKDHIVLIDAT